MKKKWSRIVFLFALIIMSFSIVVSAQDGPEDPNDPNQVPDIPLDGGVSLLVAAGVAYGIKKVRDSRKKEN